jgi:ureidoglycolate hydrolase
MPWIVYTHVKDGCWTTSSKDTADGFQPHGKGIEVKKVQAYFSNDCLDKRYHYVEPAYSGSEMDSYYVLRELFKKFYTYSKYIPYKGE